MSLTSWLTARRSALDAHLADRFSDAWPPHFAAPLRYPLFGGGKRMRPALAMAAYEAIAAEPDDLRPVLDVAAAVELVHTYSLVHDDLPCMDDDVERRGRPTVHIRFDEATAVLCGDALLTEAFVLIAESRQPAERQVQLLRLLARASGYQGMVGGQAADMCGAASDLATTTRLHQLKTGALIRCAVELGGVCAGADPATQSSLGSYGGAIGLAFQLTDDLLDEGEDEQNPTFVRHLGLSGTRSRALELSKQAIEAVQALPRPELLIALATYAVQRTS